MLEKLPKSAFFHCKKFKVRHDIAALKVTTEALVFGGFLANQIKTEKDLLEIGTGCGLLSLMIAQKNQVYIDAVEINENAFELAWENIQNSSFLNKIGVYHSSIQAFGISIAPHDWNYYDLIFTNPPFFQNNFKGNNFEKNLAKHNDTLPFDELAQQVNRFLSSKGSFIVLLPPFELKILEAELTKFGFKKNQEIYIHPTENSKILRIIATFAKEIISFQSSNFFIKNKENEYTDQFKTLLKDYYLIF